MCSVKHSLVQTKRELQDALLASRYDEIDCVIEVKSSIDANATFHRLLGANATSIIMSSYLHFFVTCLLIYCASHLSIIRKFASQASNHAFSILSRLSVQDSISHEGFICKISRMECSRFRWV